MAGRLIDPQDRQAYADLVSYFRALPPGDELFRLAQLLGFLSLVGERLPGAMGEVLQELRTQARVAGEYEARLNERLGSLPKEIADGVDANRIAQAISERFRQQIMATGLQDVTTALHRSVLEMKTLSNQLGTAMQPVSREYQAIGNTIAAEIGKLTTASRELERHNAERVVLDRQGGWWWKGMCGLVLFLLGGICGILMVR
jgi:hypothetical protein